MASGWRNAAGALIAGSTLIGCGSGGSSEISSETSTAVSKVKSVLAPVTTGVQAASTTAVAPATTLSLSALVDQPGVVGYVAAEILSGEGEFVVATVSAPGGEGWVELLVNGADGWRSAHRLAIASPREPRVLADIDGDGIGEVGVVTVPAAGGPDREIIFRIDVTGPILAEIAYELEQAETSIRRGISSLTIVTTSLGMVTTSVGTCTPDCDEGDRVILDWTLDERTMVLRPTELSGGVAAGSLDASLPLEPGASGPAVAELQGLLLASGIWVGPSGADGSYGPDTARAVALIPPGFGRTDRGDPGPDGVFTTDSLARLRAAANPPVVDVDSPCPRTEEFVRATAETATDIFRLDIIRCSSGWATADMVEYSFTDGTRLFFRVDSKSATLVGGAYGADNGCALYGVPVPVWPFFGC